MNDRAARLSENGRKSRRQHDAIESKTEILSRLRQTVGQRVDAKFRYCQIGKDRETTRRFFGKADKGQATRPQAKQDTERWCELHLNTPPDEGEVVTIDLGNVQKI